MVGDLARQAYAECFPAGVVNFVSGRGRDTMPPGALNGWQGRAHLSFGGFSAKLLGPFLGELEARGQLRFSVIGSEQTEATSKLKPRLR